MVAGPAAEHALRLARRMPSLRVGLHLVLVDGAPTLPAAELAGLVDEHGALRNGLVGVALQIALQPRARRAIVREMAAQFAAFRRTGLTLDHVNAHRHFHVHPIIAADLVSLAKDHGVKAIRAPLEPLAPLQRVEPTGSTLAERILDHFAWRLREHAVRAGLRTADATFGIRWTGKMTAGRLAGLVGQLRDGLVEVYLHPATNNAFAGSAPGYRYTDELAALVDRDVAEAIKRSPFRLGGFVPG